MPARHDYTAPPADQYGIPGVSYPTPNTADLIIVEDVPIRTNNYTAPSYGTAHPKVATALLVWEGPIKGNDQERSVRRVYATPRAAQDAYNYGVSYLSESNTHQVVIRSYVTPRSTYTPWLKGDPDTLFPDAVLVKEEMQPMEGELASLFVRVVRVFETLPGPTLDAYTVGSSGTLVRTRTQEILTDGATLPAPGLGVLSEEIQPLTSVKARRITTVITDLSGTPVETHPIFTDLEWDEKYLVQMVRAVQIVGPSAVANPIGAAFGTALRLTGAGTTEAVTAYVVGGTLKEIEGSSNRLRITLAMPIPPTRYEYPKINFPFPALFTYLSFAFETGYTGRFPQPRLGVEYNLIGHRQAARPARVTYSYSLMPSGALPTVWRIASPGAGSRMFGNLIDGNTVHSNWTVVEGASTREIVTASTLAGSRLSGGTIVSDNTYRRTDILTIDAYELPFRGLIHEKRVVEISEETNPYNF